jgi:hypothetical protein
MGDVIIDGLTGANRLVILDANGKIPALDGSAVTNVAGANFSTGTIPVARLDTGTTAGKIVKLDGTAKLPAVSGAALTGVVGATKNASDPTLSTNPSGGVGTEWQNTTSGEVYVCTDATAGANVWKNVGEQSGNIQVAHYAGRNYGFLAGGHPHSNIEKFPFATDSVSVDQSVGLSDSRAGAGAGTSSTTYGHAAGGYPFSNVIDRYAFVSTTTAVDWGNLTNARTHACGASSETYGYTMGGEGPGYGQDTNDKFPFASNAGATDVGNLYASGCYNTPASHQSATHGYVSCGTRMSPHAHSAIIDKFSFASGGDSTLVGTQTVVRYGVAGISSSTHGFSAGGNLVSTDTIDYFSFASDGNGSDWADISANNYAAKGTQSIVSGYALGGSGDSTRMDKFPFASATNATDIANLAVGGAAKSSTQY